MLVSDTCDRIECAVSLSAALGVCPVHLSLHFREALAQLLDAGKRVVDSPVHLADFGAALTSAASSQLQEVMACMDVSSWQ